MNVFIGAGKYLLKGLRCSKAPKWLSLGEKINPKSLTYTPVFKPGKLINSGREADVFDVLGYPNFVMRIDRGAPGFCPYQLRHYGDKMRGIVAKNFDETVTVMKKLSGKPLHGAKWSIYGTPDIAEYKKTLDMLEKLPDSAYEKYLDDITRIRQNGYRLDKVNPNNYLIDMEKGEINICDIHYGKNIKNYTNIEDFYPFLDSSRLIPLMKNASLAERAELQLKIRHFMDRIIKIGEKKGFDLSVEPVDLNQLQDLLVYIYHCDTKMIGIVVD